MEFPTQIDVDLSELNTHPKSIKVHGGITTILGPNGSGKTQLLRGLKQAVVPFVSGKKIRYLSAGRLGPLENFRSNFDGQRGDRPNYANAQYGNHNSLRYRHQNETVTGDFATLSERPDILIKVQERLKKLFHRDVRVDWDAGHLKVYFTKVGEQNEYSSASEASGLLHLVSILSALYDDEVGVVLIDEPEVSLHPQLQSFLYQEIVKISGSPNQSGKKLVFLSTHSTEFIHIQSVDDLATLVFCNDVNEEPIQIDPSIDEFRSRKISALLAKMGQEHKLALFCDRPLLVEGPSDQIICSGLSRILDLNTEAAGSQILPVTGKGQMPTVAKLMRLLGKTPSVLADADALADGIDLVGLFVNQTEANNKAIALGHRSASQFARDIYRDFVQFIDENWDDISAIALLHPYWQNRDTQKDEIIAKRRAAFCSLIECDVEAINQLNNSAHWKELKIRLLSLIDLLKTQGCFILKKGTIESYYLHTDQLTSDEKPNAAAHEVSCMVDVDINQLREKYEDIAEAIEFAAQAKKIDEGAAIRDMVLAIVSPALASISNTTTEAELNTNCRNLFGNRSNLFRLSVESSDKLYLVVELTTSILDVQGFPLRLAVDSNPIVSVNEQMGLE